MAKKKKSYAVALAGIAVALSTVLLVMVYGEGYFYQGALKWRPNIKVRRQVAQVTCKKDANQEGKYCVYTLEPVQYFVMKDGENFIIYGPKMGINPATGLPDPDPISKILLDNNIELNVGNNLYNAATYSITATTVDFKVGFKFLESDGVKRPTFVLDQAAAAALKDARSISVELPRSVKIRFNTIYLPK